MTVYFFYLPIESSGSSLLKNSMIILAAAVTENRICIVLFWIILLIAFERCITRATAHIEFVLEGRTKCTGGSERREDFPSVVMVR